MNSSEMTSPSALDQAAIAARVRALVADSGDDQGTFAVKVGTPYSTTRAYLSAQRLPSAEFLAGVFRTYGANPAWLLTGVGPRYLSGDGSVPKQAANESQAFEVIPLLPIHAAAGAGALIASEAEPVPYNVDGLAFSSAWLHSRNLHPASLRVIEVKGGSMDSVLRDGDKVLVNMADTAPRSGYVYVLRQGAELLVKYCQLLPDGMLRVSSANAAYQPYDIDLQRTPNVAIVGRVVASMHEW